MKIKGLTIRTNPEFVRKYYPDRYQEWLNALPETSRTIMSNHIVVNEWYPILDSLTVPLRLVGQVFYGNDWKKASWDLGRFDAEETLTGIYKLYVKFGSPSHLISRASRIMAAYYDNAQIMLIQSDKNRVVLHITRFDQPDEAIEYNMAGWIERALEISGCVGIKVELKQSLARKDPVSEFVVSWN
jgi:hypothetical protein